MIRRTNNRTRIIYLGGFGVLPTLEECVELTDEKFFGSRKIIASSNPQRKIRIPYNSCDVLDNGLFVYADR